MLLFFVRRLAGSKSYGQPNFASYRANHGGAASPHRWGSRPALLIVMSVYCPDNTKPAWQIERTQLLQSICLQIKAKVAAGKPIMQTIQGFSAIWHKQPYPSHPKRVILLAPGTLRCKWDKWRHGKENPEVFALHLRYGLSTISLRDFTWFLDYAARAPRSSLHAAYKAFKDLQHSNPDIFPQAKFTFAALKRRISAATFRRLQTAAKAQGATAAPVIAIRQKLLMQFNDGDKTE